MKTFEDLRRHSDNCLFEGDAWGALHGYAALVRLDPRHGDERLRLGDALLAAGEVQAASQIYAAVARHDAHAGYPLRALIALKLLATLEPQLSALLIPFAKLYSSESERFVGKMVRLSPPNPSTGLPDGFSLDVRPEAAQLVEVALRIGTDLSQVSVYPECLPRIPLFSDLPADAFASTLAEVNLVRVRDGHAVVQQGDVAHAFYVLARGRVEVTREDEGKALRLATLHTGSVFGEMALVAAAARSASAVAATDCDLLEFDRDALSAAKSHVAVIATALSKFSRDRLIQNLLATAPLFRSLDRKQRFDLMRRFSAHEVAEGTVLIEQGAVGDGLYLVLQGEVQVERQEGAEQVPIATLGAGEVFGEISLLQESPTSATVRALRDSNVLFLSRDVFQRLMEAVPEVRAYIEDIGSDRLVHTRTSLLDFEVGEDIEVLL